MFQSSVSGDDKEGVQREVTLNHLEIRKCDRKVTHNAKHTINLESAHA